MSPSQPKAKRLRAELLDMLIKPAECDPSALLQTVATLRSGVFAKLHDRSGRSYSSWGGFCADSPPFGLGVTARQLEKILGDCRARQFANVQK
jgi:hypothetical protein